MPNRLINEKSPYLLQHAHNPVDWYSWGDEAFDKARDEDKPVFLSIGYATCHWCHVMEKESFEDEEAAGYLNDTFVCIKVDREERPDIDTVYMVVCQMLTGRGGWPLTVFLTPDKKPFFSATYIPKRSRFGQPGLMEICQQVKTMWETNRGKIVESSEKISENIGRAFEFQAAGELNDSDLKQAFEALEGLFDPKNGGFEPAPKFPTPHRILFLMRYFYRTREPKAMDMVIKTLQAMRLGGIWDHVGFGFHRYSTDPNWLLPHFEKMLYDQALMAMAYLEAYQITGDTFFSQAAEEIFTYVLRDMTSENGVFFAAEDADSEGEEGKFYVWTLEEFRQILGPERGKLWQHFLNMIPEGNFSEEATGKKTGANILHLTRSLSAWAEKLEMPVEELTERWENTRETLFHIRSQRVHPLKDDKILTDWNGLMIAALAMGGRILGKYAYTEAARKAESFIQTRMTNEEGFLFHRYRENETKISGNANDYAFLILGLLELYKATLEPDYLSRAVSYQQQMVEDFWDDENGGFFLTSESGEKLPARPKELYDGAIPSANSVSLLNLLCISRLTGDIKWEEKANETSRSFSGSVKTNLSAFSFFLMGLEFARGTGHEIVIVGEPGSPDTEKILSTVYENYTPNSVVLLKSSKNTEIISRIAPYTKSLKPIDNHAAAYVCKKFSCSQPTDNPKELRDMIKRD